MHGTVRAKITHSILKYTLDLLKLTTTGYCGLFWGLLKGNPLENARRMKARNKERDVVEQAKAERKRVAVDQKRMSKKQRSKFVT